MKFRNQFLKYQLNFKDGEEEGGGNNGGDDQTTLIADLQDQMGKLKEKNDELLGEAKKAKNAKREAEELARTSSEEALKKAGDFESLYKSSSSELEKIKGQFSTLTASVAEEKRNNAAMKLAGELADGSNAEILSEFISKRLRHTDEGLKVTDSNGNLTVSSVDDLKREFSSNSRYASLLKGNQSSGGGATGGNGSGAAKEISLTDFQAKNPQERATYLKGGGKVLN